MESNKEGCMQVAKVAAIAIQIQNPFKKAIYLDSVCQKFKLDVDDVVKEIVRQKINNDRKN